LFTLEGSVPLGQATRVGTKVLGSWLTKGYRQSLGALAWRGAKDKESVMSLMVQALDHLVVPVSNVNVAAEWYARVLGMIREDSPPEAGKAPRTAMRFGCQKINLRPIATTKGEWFTANHEAAGSEDLCFLTDSTPEEVVRHLHAESVAIVTGPGLRQGAQGALMSVYCRDPDGSLIEIASYVEG
jgi:catechol 2,3-dioxygenase-like lactoylglutathione lyase family enzyme